MNPIVSNLSNLLKTPLEIEKALKSKFPSAQLEAYEKQDGSCKIEFIVWKAVSPILLENAVDRQVFLDYMLQLDQKACLEPISKEKQAIPPLDTDRFSLNLPLRDWQTFRRVMYENAGKSCADAVIDYLKNGECTTVDQLGLSPSYFENDWKEHDLAYFRDVFNRIAKMDSKTKNSMREQFKELYPKIYKCVIKERTSKQLENKAKDVFKEIVGQLEKSVVGQSEAVKKAASILIKHQNNNEDNHVFLFVGPTGVGKTELAKAISRCKETPLVILNMEKYTSSCDVGRFFGVSPSYVGCDARSEFAKALEPCKPLTINKTESLVNYEVKNCVILFDEFEKAHFTIKQSLLTLFSDGYFNMTLTENKIFNSVNKTEHYVFKKSIFIGTSNLYQKQMLEAFHEEGKLEKISEIFKTCNEKSNPYDDHFSPELLGRMEVTPFGPIPRGEIYQSLIKMKLIPFLEALKQELSCETVEIENEETERLLLQHLEKKLYGNAGSFD